jgi:hypothetical protein
MRVLWASGRPDTDSPAHDLEVKAMEGGRKYDAPEPREETRSKAISYAVLGILVVLLMVLIATGVVPIFSF